MQSTSARRIHSVAYVCAALLAASLVLVTGCERAEKTALPAPAQAVQTLLELRYAESTNASAFASVLKSTDLASQLADVASQTADVTSTPHPPIPAWESPYVSASDDASASVVVVWEATARMKDWPRATIFRLERIEGSWKVSDAIETTSVPGPRPTNVPSRDTTGAP